MSGYNAAGGVRSAIAETAEAVFYDQLEAEQRAIARQIFLRLTEIGRRRRQLPTPAAGSVSMNLSRSPKTMGMVPRSVEHAGRCPPDYHLTRTLRKWRTRR
ncbi:MAG: hypothetical protein MZV70_46560 [Desulfobacterales bacterium]|nr:hypothetical protein [Desulfobacterales bacterium]